MSFSFEITYETFCHRLKDRYKKYISEYLEMSMGRAIYRSYIEDYRRLLTYFELHDDECEKLYLNATKNRTYLQVVCSKDQDRDMYRKQAVIFTDRSMYVQGEIYQLLWDNDKLNNIKS